MSRCQYNISPHRPRRVECVHDPAVADYGATPHRAICRQCPHYDGPDRGMGDRVVRVLRAINPGHRPCKSCQRRREKLNNL